MTFPSLGLSEPLLRVIGELEHDAPTDIQRAMVPAVLAGGDVWAAAPTGSGKTAAFVLPLLERFARSPFASPRRVRVLVLAPTRELAAQIGEVFTTYARHLEPAPKIVTVFGGVSANAQRVALRGAADIVVATPGRLLDLVETNALSLSQVSTLVLDEADRMLDGAFADELRDVLALVPRQRQTVLASATFARGVEALARATLHEPTRIDLARSPAAPPEIHERAIEVDAPRRTQLLRHLITTHRWPRVLVFVATQHAAEHVADKLRGLGIGAAAFHGKLSQGARTDVLDAFRASELRVLVATDLAGRGLDITGLPAVVSFDLPRAPGEYVHRIGRTGRAGEAGVAISFVTPESHAHFQLIERRAKRLVEREQVEGFEPVGTPPAPVRDGSTGGVKGHRKSKKDKLREAAAALASRSSEPRRTS
ncbi:MAG: DEAD/DEAH box helicase [Deltaproteobacteria bacterium]|nr:DEAD/DEAH box helicase [Deltaproteobacteria bacterium]